MKDLLDYLVTSYEASEKLQKEALEKEEWQFAVYQTGSKQELVDLILFILGNPELRLSSCQSRQRANETLTRIRELYSYNEDK